MSRPRSNNIGAPRVARFKRLIEGLRKMPMNRAQVAELLHITHQHASKCLCELEHRGITFRLERESASHSSKRVSHALIADDEKIAAFFASLTIVNVKKLSKPVIDVDSSRHIHLIHDDSFTAAEPAELASIDPLALPAGFFKPSPDFIERRQVVRTPVPQPTGFAALEFAHFERWPA